MFENKHSKKNDKDSKMQDDVSTMSPINPLRIWVPTDNSSSFKNVLATHSSLTTYLTEDGSTFNISRCAPANPPAFDTVDDLAQLSHLNEPSVLYTLNNRYSESKIYTNSGMFLIGVNPYRQIVDDNVKGTTQLPHIYTVSHQAYTDLIDSGVSQSILITGESGAGKTENTKKVIEYLSSIGERNGLKSNELIGSTTDINSLLVLTNPILEAFGNAKTVKNDNSSRFGKYIQIFFNKNNIVGGKINKYLLEKSRLCYRNELEQNYHIFYTLLAANDEIRKPLFIDSNFQYMCISSNGKNTVSHSNHTVNTDCESLITMLEAFGIDHMEYFRVVAGIMHLSNVIFVNNSGKIDIKPNSMNDKSDMSSISIACDLLGINQAALLSAIIHPQIHAGNEVVEVTRNEDQCNKIVEGIIKVIYERMFDRLIDQINDKLDLGNSNSSYNNSAYGSTSFIGILDIAGFEIFKQNSLEQLLINFTNEKLQQFFNHHMFVREQAVYEKEGIDWDFIDFGLDLEPCISTIESNSPIGILSYLDEECVMPGANDRTFAEKIHTIQGRDLKDDNTNRFNGSIKQDASSQANPVIVNVDYNNLTFVLKHYAGNVEYDVSDWIEKNKDYLHSEVESVIKNNNHGDNPIRRRTHKNNTNNLARNSNIIKKGFFRTVSQSHRDNLNQLMSLLNNTQPHFVRCILPNLQKVHNLFNNKLVLDQLRCNGVLEGIRISRIGFPSRMEYDQFISKYKCIHTILLSSFSSKNSSIEGLTDDISSKPVKEASKCILDSSNLSINVDYKYGKTKIFFKTGILAELENRREKVIEKIGFYIAEILKSKLQIERNKRIEKVEAAVKSLKFDSLRCIDLLKSNWWKMYQKVKPLLNEAVLEKNREKEKIEIEKIKVNYENERKKYIEEFNNNRSLYIEEFEINKQIYLNEWQSLKQQYEQQIICSEEQIREYKQKIMESDKLISSNNSEISKYRKELEKLMVEQDEMKKSNSDHIEEMNEKISDISKTLNNKITDLKNREAEQMKLIEGFKQSGNEFEKQLADCKKELVELRAINQSLTNENNSNKVKLSNLKSEKEEIEETFENESHKFEEKVLQLTESLKVESENYKKLKKQFDDITENYKKSVRECKDTSEEHEKITRKFNTLNDKYNSSVEKYNNLLNEMEQEGSEVNEKYNELQNTYYELVESEKDLRRDLEQRSKQNEELAVTIEELTSKNDHLAGQVDEMSKSNEKIKKSNLELVKSIEDKAKAFEKVKKSLTEVSENTNKKYNIVSNKLEAQKSEYAELKLKFNEQQEKCDSLNSTFNKLNSDYNETINELIQCKSLNDEKDSQMANLEELIQEKDKKIKDMKSRIDELEDEIVELKKSHSIDQQRLEAIILKLESGNKKYENQVKDLSVLVERLKGEKGDLERTLNVKNRENSLAMEQMEDKLNRYTFVETELKLSVEESNGRVIELSEELNKTTKENSELEIKATNYKNELEKLHIQYNRLQKETEYKKARANRSVLSMADDDTEENENSQSGNSTVIATQKLEIEHLKELNKQATQENNRLVENRMAELLENENEIAKISKKYKIEQNKLKNEISKLQNEIDEFQQIGNSSVDNNGEFMETSYYKNINSLNSQIGDLEMKIVELENSNSKLQNEVRLVKRLKDDVNEIKGDVENILIEFVSKMKLQNEKNALSNKILVESQELSTIDEATVVLDKNLKTIQAEYLKRIEIVKETYEKQIESLNANTLNKEKILKNRIKTLEESNAETMSCIMNVLKKKKKNTSPIASKVSLKSSVVLENSNDFEDKKND